MPVHDASNYPYGDNRFGARPTFHTLGERNKTSAYNCELCGRFIVSHGRVGHEDMHAQFAAKAARNVFTDEDDRLIAVDYQLQSESSEGLDG